MENISGKYFLWQFLLVDQASLLDDLQLKKNTFKNVIFLKYKIQVDGMVRYIKNWALKSHNSFSAFFGLFITSGEKRQPDLRQVKKEQNVYPESVKVFLAEA